MSFKDMVNADIHGVFLNAGEFADRRTVIYDGKTYADIPVVLSGIKEKDRRQLVSDHVQGLYMVSSTLHAALDDFGGVLPEKGMRIRINDRELGRPKPVKHCPYLYEIRYAKIDYAKANEFFKRYKPPRSGCSVVARGNLIGRNFDMNYNNVAGFVVRTEATFDRHAVVGIAKGTDSLTDAFVRSGADSADYDVLPFLLHDGVNDAGLFCEINIVAADKGRTTGTNPAGEDMFAAMITRYVLDYASSVDEAIALIRGRNIFCPDTGGRSEEYHFLLKDGQKTAVVEFVQNEVVAIDTFVDDMPIMTNHHLYGFDGTRETLTPYAMGIERYAKLKSGYGSAINIARMTDLMKSVWYTRAYSPDEDPVWRSEFAGKYEQFGDLTKDSPPEAYDGILAYARDQYQRRSRNTGITWHTVHTSVYDLSDKSLSVIPQEGEDNFSFRLDDGGIASDRNAGFFRDFYIASSGIEMGMVRLELEAIDE